MASYGSIFKATGQTDAEATREALKVDASVDAHAFPQGKVVDIEFARQRRQAQQQAQQAQRTQADNNPSDITAKGDLDRFLDYKAYSMAPRLPFGRKPAPDALKPQVAPVMQTPKPCF